MRSLLLPALLFSDTLVASTQTGKMDHAPTVDQCAADVRLWPSQMTEYLDAETARINTGAPNSSELMKLTARQLNDRAYEMGQCAFVDPSHQDDYNHQLGLYGEARKDRYVAFVRRHHLEKEFYQEDEAGKR